MDTAEELLRHLRALGYDEVAIAPVPTGGPSTAVYRVEGAHATGRATLRLQGTMPELRDHVARLPRRPRAARGGPAPDRSPGKAMIDG